MKNNKAFSLIEVLVAVSIFFLVFTMILPLQSFVHYEQKRLQEKLTMTSKLHDELQLRLWDKTKENNDFFTIEIANSLAEFKFTQEQHLIKGCVSWQNVKQKSEKICLYGHPQI